MRIVANWKAYVENVEKAKKLFAKAKQLTTKSKVHIVLVPSEPYLGLWAPINKSKVSFGAQNVSTVTGGAHTGETTAATLASLGVRYVIVGHSERRAAGESAGEVAQKVDHALAHGLTPILCVGEKERDAEGKYLAFVRDELTSALTPLAPKDRARVIVAYEPIWAIGKSAAEAITPLDLSEMVLYIRKVLAELLPGKSSAQSEVLYGGSVEPENVRDLAAASRVDGFLVGHASVDLDSFAGLVRALS
jgi:triosephosphate isomerase